MNNALLALLVTVAVVASGTLVVTLIAYYPVITSAVIVFGLLYMYVLTTLEGN